MDIMDMKALCPSIVALAERVKDALEFDVDFAYLQKKFDDHRRFTFVVLLLLCMAAVGSWPVDWIIDPVGAQHTIWVRLAFIPAMVLPGLAILRIRSYRRVLPFGLVIGVLTEVHQILILSMLEGGFTKGIGLFLYFPFGATVLCLGFSFRASLGFLGLVTVLPPVLIAATGWPPGFPQAMYAMVLWPATVMTALISASFASSYRKRYLLERALEQASNTDPLTGVANRRQFQVLLQRAMARSQRRVPACALLMLDIDHFKRINDGHGHPTGDRAICALADLCVASSRATDLVARLGGEEFAVLMPATSADEGWRLAERLRQRVQTLVVHSDAGVDVRWTVSVGVAFAPQAEAEDLLASCERLISRADAALYEAKSSGRNRVAVHFDDALPTWPASLV